MKLVINNSLISFEIEETGSDMSLYKGAGFGVVMVDFPWKEKIHISNVNLD